MGLSEYPCEWDCCLDGLSVGRFRRYRRVSFLPEGIARVVSAWLQHYFCDLIPLSRSVAVVYSTSTKFTLVVVHWVVLGQTLPHFGHRHLSVVQRYLPPQLLVLQILSVLLVQGW